MPNLEAPLPSSRSPPPSPKRPRSSGHGSMGDLAAGYDGHLPPGVDFGPPKPLQARRSRHLALLPEEPCARADGHDARLEIRHGAVAKVGHGEEEVGSHGSTAGGRWVGAAHPLRWTIGVCSPPERRKKGRRGGGRLRSREWRRGRERGTPRWASRGVQGRGETVKAVDPPSIAGGHRPRTCLGCASIPSLLHPHCGASFPLHPNHAASPLIPTILLSGGVNYLDFGRGPRSSSLTNPRPVSGAMADAGEPLCAPWLGIQGQGWPGLGVHNLHTPMETVEGDGAGAAWCGRAQGDVRHVGPPCRFRFPAAGDHRWTCAPFTAANTPTLLLGIKVEKIVLLLWRVLAGRNCGGQKEHADQITFDVELLMSFHSERWLRPRHLPSMLIDRGVQGRPREALCDTSHMCNSQKATS